MTDSWMKDNFEKYLKRSIAFYVKQFNIIRQKRGYIVQYLAGAEHDRYLCDDGNMVRTTTDLEKATLFESYYELRKRVIIYMNEELGYDKDLLKDIKV